jgi:prepilin-type N-terminal cleavage/methylation domain-containing protein
LSKPMKKSMHCNKGITLIEIMFTLAIVSMLTVASLNITINLAAAQRGDRKIHVASASDVQLRELFRIDLAHMHEYRIREAGLQFRTRAILNEDLEIRHLPAVIDYEIRRIDERAWLLRNQTCNRRTMTELVCPDVKTVSLKTVGGADDSPEAHAQMIQWRPLPKTTTIVVEFEDRPGKPTEFTHTAR